MPFQVVFTEAALNDLASIYDYILATDSESKANYVIERLVEAADKLSQYPDRGPIPAELRSLGLREYRQTFFKPYRLIYRVMDDRVVVHVVADGRRDMQTLLATRLLES